MATLARLLFSERRRLSRVLGDPEHFDSDLELRRGAVPVTQIGAVELSVQGDSSSYDDARENRC